MSESILKKAAGTDKLPDKQEAEVSARAFAAFIDQPRLLLAYCIMCLQMCRLPTHSLLCFRFGIPLPDTGKLLKGRYAEEESCNTGGHQYDDGDDSGEDAYRKGLFSLV